MSGFPLVGQEEVPFSLVLGEHSLPSLQHTLPYLNQYTLMQVHSTYCTGTVHCITWHTLLTIYSWVFYPRTSLSPTCHTAQLAQVLAQQALTTAHLVPTTAQLATTTAQLALALAQLVPFTWTRGNTQGSQTTISHTQQVSWQWHPYMQNRAQFWRMHIQTCKMCNSGATW